VYNGGGATDLGPSSRLQLFPHADHVSDAKIIGRGAFEPESTGVAPHFGDTSRRQRPRLASRQRPEARANLVSATVYLRPDKLALIKQNCSDTNRRISDLISEAVDDYLRKPR
jgi:hypothetical protein